MKTGTTVYLCSTEPLSDPALYARAAARAPESRIARAAALKHEESRRQSMGAGLLLSAALAERGIDGRTAAIAEGPWGKPYLPEHPETHFSLSHAGKWAMCAAGDARLGCDTERIGRGSERLADRFFHPEEQAYLRSAGRETDEAWQRVFSWIWTRKESYLKATGQGITVPLSGFSVLGDPPGGRFCGAPAPAAESAFSLCIFGEPAPPPVWRVVFLRDLL